MGGRSTTRLGRWTGLDWGEGGGVYGRGGGVICRAERHFKRRNGVNLGLGRVRVRVGLGSGFCCF